MFCYIYFILIFYFDIIVKVYGNSAANLIDYIIQHANNEGMKYVREEHDTNTTNKKDTAQNDTTKHVNDMNTNDKYDTAQNDTKNEVNDIMNINNNNDTSQNDTKNEVNDIMNIIKNNDTSQNDTKNEVNDIMNIINNNDTSQNDTKNEVNDIMNIINNNDTSQNDTKNEVNDIMNINNTNDTAQNVTKKDDLNDHEGGDNLENIDDEGDKGNKEASESEPEFEPHDAIANITSDQIFSVMANKELLNEIVKEQIIFMYGAYRSSKYEYVANAVWAYFRSILGNRPIVTLPTPKNPFLGCTMKTLGPIEDYNDPEEFTTTNDDNSTQQENQTRPAASTNSQEKPDNQDNSTESTNFTTTLAPPSQEKNTENSYITTTLKLEIQTTEDQLTTTNLPDTLYQPPRKSNKLPVRRGAHPQTQYPSIKSPNQRDQFYPSTWAGSHNVLYLSTSGQQMQYLKMLPDLQEKQSTPTKKIHVDVVRQGITPADPAYYELDATTGSSRRVAPRTDSLILGITKLPRPSTEHPIVKNVKTRMVSKKHGYFTAFVQQLCTIMAVKDPLQSKKLYRALHQVISKMIHQQGRLAEMGIRFQTAITSMLRTLTALEPDVVQSYVSIAGNALDEKDVAADVQSLLHNLDDIYSSEEGKALLNTLVQVYNYPKNGSALDVAESVVEKVFSPYFRISRRRQFLIQLIYNVIEKRNLGRRRRIEDLDDRMFNKVFAKKKNVNRGFDETIISKDDENGKVTISFTKLNAIEVNEAKDLIKNFKVKEFIKKYETKIARVTAKPWSHFYKTYEKSSNFRKRVNFDRIQPKKNDKSNSFSSETVNINYDSKTIKMADDGINKSSMKEVIENYNLIDAIKKYETKIVQVTAKLWSNVYTVHVKPSNFRKKANFEKIQSKNNMKSTRETIKNNFNNKEAKTVTLDNGVIKHKIKTKKDEIKSKKVSQNNIYSELDIETDRLSVSTSENESVSKTRQNEMENNMKYKIRNHWIRKHAKLTESSKKHYEIKNRRQTNVKIKALSNIKGQNRFIEVKKPHEEPSFKDKTRASDNERPSYNMRHSNEENRRLPDNRRHYGSKRRPPGANRRPSDSITRNPDANLRPSMYLTPRYEYNSRRFIENLNLTRRSNAKPISTEPSYSYEEKDIKFYIQDAIRHPIDLKSKIQQNSLIFDKVQNGRRQMAPVDRISLRHESSYSDDELTIKNNIYKVFNKNN